MPRLFKGDKMPNFDVTTMKNEKTTLFHLSAGKPTVMLTLRHIGCPITRLDVQEFCDEYDAFVEKDVNVVLVLQSSPAVVMEVMEEQEVPFPIICDEKQEIYKKLQVSPAKTGLHFMKGSSETRVRKSLAKQAGFVQGEKEGHPLQLPAFFYFDRYRIVTECHYAEYLCDMPTIKQFTDNV